MPPLHILPLFLFIILSLSLFTHSFYIVQTPFFVVAAVVDFVLLCLTTGRKWQTEAGFSSTRVSTRGKHAQTNKSSEEDSNNNRLAKQLKPERKKKLSLH